MGISLINDDGTQTPLQKDVNSDKYRTFDNKSFSASEESLPAKVARNAYKFPASVVSTALGFPGDVANTLINARNETSKNGDWAVDKAFPMPQIPNLPKWLTSAGMKENITEPVGESLFGKGSQQPQEGMVEGALDKAAEWFPYLISPSKGALKGANWLKTLGKGFGLSLAQGAAGQGLKEAGVGDTGQLIGESLTGMGLPLIGKGTFGATKRATVNTAKNLEKGEKAVWNNLREKAPTAKFVDTSIPSMSLENIKEDLIKKVGPTERAGTEALFNEVLNDIGKGKTSVSDLVDARRKVSSHFKAAGISGTTAQWHDFKTTLDDHIGKYMGSTHTKALDATKIKKAFEETDAYRKFVKNAPELADNKAVQALLNYAPLGGAAVLLALKNPTILASTIGARVGTSMYKNAKMIFGNKQLTNAAIRSAGRILKRGITGTIGMAVKKGFDGKDIQGKRTITILD